MNNNIVTDKAYTSVGGAISQGEFGSMMREIFDPKSSTEFSWERWATLREHDTYVFAYRVPPPLHNTQFTIKAEFRTRARLSWWDIMVAFSLTREPLR